MGTYPQYHFKDNLEIYNSICDNDGSWRMKYECTGHTERIDKELIVKAFLRKKQFILQKSS
jgi:hypothetical protein